MSFIDCFPPLPCVKQPNIFGVARRALVPTLETVNTDALWIRTDKSTTFANPEPYVSGATEYHSPFDEYMPWAGMVVSEREDCGAVVAIPKFWYQLTSLDDGGLNIRIADGPVDGFNVSPAHIDRGDGVGERDVVYIGRYDCADTFKSTSGVLPVTQVSKVGAREGIHALGSDVWQLDFTILFTIWLLYLVEYADWDSQKVIGCGVGSGAFATSGYTDAMPYHTGTTLTDRVTAGVGVQYRNIEGLWDNVHNYLDGCYIDEQGFNIILNPTNFSGDNGSLVGSYSGHAPATFNVVNACGFDVFWPVKAPAYEVNGTYDIWSTGSISRCIIIGAYPRGQVGCEDYGIFYLSRSISDGGNVDGCRLMVLPS